MKLKVEIEKVTNTKLEPEVLTRRFINYVNFISYYSS